MKVEVTTHVLQCGVNQVHQLADLCVHMMVLPSNALQLLLRGRAAPLGGGCGPTPARVVHRTTMARNDEVKRDQ